MDETLNNLPEHHERESRPVRRSRAAEYIAALYIALVLATPWLLRDAQLFAPSKGVEIQMSYRAAPAAAPAPDRRAAAPVDPSPRATAGR